ncbi:MAG: EAL domain-containing protein [Mobilitalea sp.]
MLRKLKEILHNLRNNYKGEPFKISMLYFVISCLWILLSDRIVHELFSDRRIELTLNTFKGWLYVVAITVILYVLLSRSFRKLKEAESKMMESFMELTTTHEELEEVNRELSVSQGNLNEKYDEIKTSDDRFKRAQLIAHVGNWELDIVGQTVWASEEAFLIYGIPYETSYMSYKLAKSLVHPDDRAKMDLALKQLISENAEYNVEFRLIEHDGNPEKIIHSMAEIEYNAAGIPAKVLGVIREITKEKLAEENILQSHEELTALYEELTASDEELRQQYDQIHDLAYNDSITGLPNRLWLQEKLINVIQTVSTKVALLFIDLDNFKNINDTFGHFYGDTILLEIGKRLAAMTDADVFVARLGGDEFAVVITNVSLLEQVKKYTQELLTKLETNINENNISIHLSASIGIAIYPDHAKSFEQLLKNADTAMYKSKKYGKNQYTIFDQSMNDELYAKVIMEGNLRTALDNNELILYYQPFYCLNTNKILGFEALIRWNSPVYGMIAPSVFIPLAEETGLILPIGKWVLNTACNYINQLNKFREDKLIISINISVHQLAQDSFAEEVLNIVKKNGLDTEVLILEITESILMDDVESNLVKIDTLKQNGIKFALDDFGTGYSSLTYLKKLPISILKLDKSFIDGIATNQIDNDIVKSIIMMAKTLDLTVVAEGVEMKNQFNLLFDLGCDLIQGYYISKPLPEDAVEEMLKHNFMQSELLSI